MPVMVDYMFEYLKADADINAMSEGNIYIGRAPNRFNVRANEQPISPMLVLRESGGDPQFRTHPLMFEELDTIIAHPDYNTLREYDRLVRDAFSRLSREYMTITRNGINYSRMFHSAAYTGSFFLIDRDTGWETLLRVIKILTDEREFS